MYIIIAIIAFGLLIAVHELGHFMAAKACGVKVNEFAIGMGPKLFSKKGKETVYSLRLLPIGGFCAMEGEDEDSGDERAFSVQNRFKKFIILFAGAFMNFLFGLLIIAIIFANVQGYVTPEITELAPEFPNEGQAGLMEGDEIYSINGMRIYYIADFSTAMSRFPSPVDVTVIRDGEKVTLENYELVPREIMIDGQTEIKYGITFTSEEATFGGTVKYIFYNAWNFVRMVWYGLADLVRGAVSVKDMSGVVGIVSVMNEVGTSAESVKDGLLNVLYLAAFIAVNLAVMNLLPIPALDGGRIFALVITWAIEKVIGHKLDPKYEGYIHMVGLVLLMGLMIVVMFNDVVRIING